MGNKDFILEIKDVSKSFNANTVLNKVSFALRNNECIAIIGRSGTGKSILIKCIVSLIIPDEGRIIFKGTDLLQMKSSTLNKTRQNIGYLFQGAALYDSMTIEENLLFPLKRNKPELSANEMDDLVNDTLEKVGLTEAKYKMPGELSGGMKKRAGLARTLILKPEIILYDEPTTGLDNITSKEIIKLIQKVNEEYKTSAIIVTHDVNCMKLAADKIIVLEEGGIIEEGSFNQLLNSDNKMVRDFVS